MQAVLGLMSPLALGIGSICSSQTDEACRRSGSRLACRGGVMVGPLDWLKIEIASISGAIVGAALVAAPVYFYGKAIG